MVKEKQKSGASAKTIFLWIFAILGFLLLIFLVFAFISVGLSDDNIEEMGKLGANYINNYEAFSDEYAISDPTSVTSLAVLPRAEAAALNAKKYLLLAKGNATEILTMVSEIKPDYSDDQLVWLNDIETCYLASVNELNLYDEILINEQVYYSYFKADKNYEKIYEEFLQVLDSYLAADTEQEAINELNKVRTKVVLLKQYSAEAYAAIPFTYYRSANTWATKYLEGIDLALEYFASPNFNTEKQMNDKYNDASRAMEGVTSTSVDEEFDAWYNSNLLLKMDEASRQNTAANAACDKASYLFETAFPGNANVIKNINYSA